MRRDGRLDVLDPVGLEPLEGSGFVQLHQSAVAGDIRGEDGGELPFHERAVLSQHYTPIRVETRLSKLLVRVAFGLRRPKGSGAGGNLLQKVRKQIKLAP